jgi:hypothetical protein
MKIFIVATALLITSVFVYAQVPQQTDMAGAKQHLVFGNQRVTPISESVSRRQTLTATEKVPHTKIVTTDLNATPTQLAQRYGKPVKTEPSFFGKGTSYGFQPTKNSYVYATTDPSGALIGSVMYFKFDGPFTQEEKETLFRKNVDPGHVWDGYNFANWDGTHDYKRLGTENGIHKVIREANGPGVVIGNDHRDDKSGAISYEVRTGEQFAVEQPIIKKLIQDRQVASGVRDQVKVAVLERVDQSQTGKLSTASR